MRNRKDWREIDYIELVKHAHANPRAKEALDHYHRLAEEMRKSSSWAKLEIRFSDFHGYTVKDPLAIPRKPI